MLVKDYDEMTVRRFLQNKSIIQSLFDCIIDYVEIIETNKGKLLIIQFYHKGKVERYESYGKIIKLKEEIKMKKGTKLLLKLIGVSTYQDLDNVLMDIQDEGISIDFPIEDLSELYQNYSLDIKEIMELSQRMKEENIALNLDYYIFNEDNYNITGFKDLPSLKSYYTNVLYVELQNLDHEEAN